MNRGKIRLREVNAKCRHLKKRGGGLRGSAADHILQEFYTLYLTRVRTYKIARPTSLKNLGGDGASGRTTPAAKSLYR
jgi:hypothetical protein